MIGILSMYYNNYNCGGQLQAYGLCNLKKMVLRISKFHKFGASF